MELHQLTYLLRVIEHGSFTAAANALHVSQSGVSAQVAKLERELGHRLLERGSRSVRPTAAAEQLLPLVREALGAVEGIGAVADELSSILRGRVRVGMATGCTTAPFLDGLAAFAREHDQVAVQLTEGGSDELLARVAAGELDAALTGYAADPPPTLRAAALVDEPVAVVLPLGHRLAGSATSRRLSPARLQDAAVLCLPPGAGVRGAFDQTCRRAGVAPAIAVEASSPDALLRLVRQGLGVAILTESMVNGSDLLVRPLAGAVRARFGLVTRTGFRPPAAEALVATLHSALGLPR